jgi:hypothetical protein
MVVAQQLSHSHLPQQRQQPPQVKEFRQAVSIPRYEVLSANNQRFPRISKPAEVGSACKRSGNR